MSACYAGAFAGRAFAAGTVGEAAVVDSKEARGSGAAAGTVAPELPAVVVVVEGRGGWRRLPKKKKGRATWVRRSPLP